MKNSAKDQWCLILDNILLRSVTRVGNYNISEKVFSHFDKESYLSSRPNNWLITPANIIEFLGIKIEKIPFDFKKMEEQISECVQWPDFKYIDISIIIENNTNRYEEALRNAHIFSRTNINKMLAVQMSFTDESIKENIQISFERATKKIYRDMMYSTVAMERIQSYRWPSHLRRQIISAYIREAHYFKLEKVNFNFARFNSNLIHDFFDYFVVESRNGTSKGDVSDEQIRENLNQMKRSTLFKKDEDLLDTEAISMVCLGNFESGKRIRILFATQDSVDRIILRISFFKSIVSNLMNTYKNPKLGSGLDFYDGKVIVFNSDFDPTYIIDVSKIFPLGDELFNSSLSDVVLNYKNQFRLGVSKAE